MPGSNPALSSGRDSQDRLFAATTRARVLETGPHAIQAAAIQAAISLPLWEDDFEVYLPLVLH
jgi:hypothetical protein